ncbi:MAG: short-chain dehydrogenase/reductase [Frankiales bacterium]|nr:short-chain dehydrogenase/reductase [Frankiales bacterium]
MIFEGYRVLVTGGSRGIGRAVCEAFAREGARVAVHSSGRTGAVSLDGLAGEGHLAVSGDVADPEAVATFVQEAADGLGGLDVLVNNAAVFDQLDPRTASYGDWQRHWRHTVEVDLLGPAWASHCALPHLVASGRGRIVNVGSRGASRGEPRAVAYGAAKAGLTAMGQSLALAYAADGVAVTSVLPGFVETEMATSVLEGPDGDAVRAQSPTGRVARPEEVAAAVLHLASAGAFWSTGAVLDVNGASYLRS